MIPQAANRKLDVKRNTMTPEQNTHEAAELVAAEAAPAPADDEDFLAGTQACDLSGEGNCEACQ